MTTLRWVDVPSRSPVSIGYDATGRIAAAVSLMGDAWQTWVPDGPAAMRPGPVSSESADTAKGWLEWFIGYGERRRQEGVTP